MLKTIKNWNHFSLIWLLFGFSLLYLSIAFPFSYFRHDDWLMVGNVTRIIPERWHFIFEPYLIFNSTPEIWFFRPWFKLSLFLLYQTFGFQYYGWLAVNLILTLGALVFGFLSITEINQSRIRGILFVCFFIFSVHFHFGSLVWAGEGTMNCPQLFLLFLNFYCFSKSLNCKLKWHFVFFYSLSLISFVLSLGFKEAAIFHLPFLLLPLLCSTQSLKFTIRTKIFLLIPFVILGGGYLYFRLFFFPFNPGYKPVPNVNFILIPILFLLGSLLMPIFSFMVGSTVSKIPLHKVIRETLSRSFYLLLFVPFFITYMGHGFFSPGWLLAPGMYFALVAGLTFPTSLLNQRLVGYSLFFSLVFSSALVFYQTNQISWWAWYKPQRQILSLIQTEGSSNIKTIEIYNCEFPRNSGTHIERVVGYPDAIQEIFWLAHKTLPNVKLLPCDPATSTLASNASETLRLKWKFPEFTLLKN